MGSAYCTKAVWETMREQAYGRIVFTSSSTGLYGNFGQTNYGAAKMAMVGMMNTLHLEGAKYNIRVNCLAPAAGTAMTEGLIPEAAFKLLSPESVSPGVVFLVSEDAPSRTVLCAGGGSFAVYKGFETEGVNLAPDRVTAGGRCAVLGRNHRARTACASCRPDSNKPENSLSKARRHWASNCPDPEADLNQPATGPDTGPGSRGVSHA